MKVSRGRRAQVSFFFSFFLSFFFISLNFIAAKGGSLARGRALACSHLQPMATFHAGLPFARPTRGRVVTVSAQPVLCNVPLAPGPLQVLPWAEDGKTFRDPFPEPNAELRSYVTDPTLCKDMCNGRGVCTREHHGCLYAPPTPAQRES